MTTADAQTKEQLLHNLRHSATHVMAQAVQEIYPGTKLTIGPPIEDGFYYDFDSTHRFTPEDLEKIEKRMVEICKENHPFVMSTHTSADAIAFWEKRSEKYKVEIIKDLAAETVTYCSHGSFVDLCRGGHVGSTGDIKHFKLLKIAGSYWRGDEKREQLQRIYGTAWTSAEELKAYLDRQEEAKKRDHRELGPRLDLFTLLPDTIGPGLIFWLPKGTKLRQYIEDILRAKLEASGYQFVVTPHIANVELWKTSGHWGFYQENMFSPMKVDNQEYLLKPMNCPGHIQIYKHGLHSYRELPIRITEMGTVYRYERSGVMHGLLRVRGFTQDDAHIFCRPDQLADEVGSILDLMFDVLHLFGFDDLSIRLSTRPEKYVGTLENWNRAESALKSALESKGKPFTIDEGEGVFYGPKIDIKIKDSLNRYWQCSTVQVDFNLPERFGVTYRDETGKEQTPIMVHRALLGSIERFIGVLIEHYAGRFPIWLSPVQARILNITDAQIPYANEVAEKLRNYGLRVEIDDRNEKVGQKIRTGTMEKIPYLIVVGDKEKAAAQIAVRPPTGENWPPMSVEAFIEKISSEWPKKLPSHLTLRKSI